MPTNVESTHNKMALQIRPYVMPKLSSPEFATMPIFVELNTIIKWALDSLYRTKATVLGNDVVKSLNTKFTQYVKQWLHQFEVIIYDDDLPRFRQLSKTLVDQLLIQLNDPLQSKSYQNDNGGLTNLFEHVSIELEHFIDNKCEDFEDTNAWNEGITRLIETYWSAVCNQLLN